VWLDFALSCNYVSKELFDDYNNKSSEIGKLLNYMLINPEKFS